MSMNSTQQPDTTAVLVGIQLPGMSDGDLTSSLDELERLASTLGLRAVARVTQVRPHGNAATVLGSGKLRELARWTGGPGVVPSSVTKRQKGVTPEPPEPVEEPYPNDVDELDTYVDAELEETTEEEFEQVGVVLFDQDLTPSQLRSLEGATGSEVLDRSSLILNIFERHARTHEARLQVEIARLTYLAPRLRATGGGGDRQRGGVGGKGAGESALELDRRRVRDRIAELKQEIVVVQREAQTRRSRRVRHDTIALVGYTNAGKSSLMRGLTGSEVLVQDQLFATLDTTVRILQPETRPRILVSDTVGFINKLPHDLVASFRSTLEEARGAALLVHVVDASDPAWRLQHEVTSNVLDELDAGDSPSLIVLNKADRLTQFERAKLEAELPDAVIMSAFDRADLARLHARIVTFFERDMIEEELFVSYTQGRMVHTIHESCRVVAKIHEDDGTRLTVRAPVELIAELRANLEASTTAES